jgi:lysophospholipase L1-like esterase
MRGLDLDASDLTDAGHPRPLVLLGASYLASWRLPEIAGRAVINRGVPGGMTASYLERFQRDVVDLQARAVVIWGVDNDIIRSPLGGMDEACDAVERNLAALVALARAHDIEPIMVTDLTIRPPARRLEWLAALIGRIRGREGYQQGINRRVLRLNAFVRAFTAANGVRLLDLHPLVSGRDGMRLRRYAKRDGSHLPPEGYQAINDYAVPLLTKWLAAPQSASMAQPASAAGAVSPPAPRVRTFGV